MEGLKAKGVGGKEVTRMQRVGGQRGKMVHGKRVQR